MKLPNIKNTWKPLRVKVESFDDWEQRQSISFASKEAKLLSYLNELYMKRGDHVSPSPIGDICLFARELRMAIDQISVLHSTEYADRLIRGERLAVDLHPEYVASTKCYG